MIGNDLIPRLGKVLRGSKQNGYRKKVWVGCTHCEKKRWINLPSPVGQYDKLKALGFRTGCPHCATPNKPKPPGYRIKRTDGYIYIKLAPDSPYYSMAHTGGWVSEHRLVMAEALSRPLQCGEIIHHKNSDKSDNRLENLEILQAIPHRQYHLMKDRIIYLEKKLNERGIEF